jgi:acyl-CoA thioesterase I
MKLHRLFLANLLVLNAFAISPLAPLKPSSPQALIKVACVGDSITQGSGAADGQSYPSQLQTFLGEKWQVGNFGVSARTLLKNGDFPYWKENAYQEALKFEPNAVIIMLGTNDTKPHNWKFESEFAADYTALVKSFQSLATKPRVYLCRPCPVPEPGNFGINEKNVKEEIRRIDKLAKDLNLPVIDMHKALERKPELLPDRVHPNTEGAGEMAKAAFTGLTGKHAPKEVKK